MSSNQNQNIMESSKMSQLPQPPVVSASSIVTVLNDNNNQMKQNISYEDALNQIGFGKSQIIIILTSGLIVLCVITETMGISMIMSAAQCDLDLNDTRKGLISSISFLGILLASQLWGYLADTKGRRKVIIYSMLVANIFTILSSFSTSFLMFILTRFFVGFFIASSSATIYAYAGEFNIISNRASVIAYICIFAGLGNLYFPSFGWAILQQTWSLQITEQFHYRPWRLLLIVNMIPGLLGIIFLTMLPESGQFLYSKGDYLGATKVLKWIHKLNNSKLNMKTVQLNNEQINANIAIEGDNINEIKPEDKNHCCSPIKSFWNQTVPLFKKPLRFNYLIICFLSFGVFFVSAGIGMWYADIQNRLSSTTESDNYKTICGVLEMDFNDIDGNYNNNNQRINLFVNKTLKNEQICDDIINEQTFIDSIILGGYYFGVYIVYAVLVKFIDQAIMLRIFLVLSGGAGLSLQWLTQPIATVVLFSSHIIFSGACISILTGLTVCLIPTDYRGMAVSISLMIGRLGSIVGSNIVGILLELNCSLTFYLYTGFILACAAISLFLPTKDKTN